MIRETSKAAYNKIKSQGLLSERRMEVYHTLYMFGPLTASELSELLPKKVSRTIGSNVHARLGELRQLGVAKEVRERKCEISGQNVIEWDVTDKLPGKLNKQIKPETILYCNVCCSGGWRDDFNPHRNTNRQLCLGKIKKYKEIK